MVSKLEQKKNLLFVFFICNIFLAAPAQANDLAKIDYTFDENRQYNLAVTSYVILNQTGTKAIIFSSRVNRALANQDFAELSENETWFLNQLLDEGRRFCKKKDPHLELDMSSIRVDAHPVAPTHDRTLFGESGKKLHEEARAIVHAHPYFRARPSLYRRLKNAVPAAIVGGLLGVTAHRDPIYSMMISIASAVISGGVYRLLDVDSTLYEHYYYESLKNWLDGGGGAERVFYTRGQLGRAWFRPGLVFSGLNCVGEKSKISSTILNQANEKGTLTLIKAQKDVRLSELHGAECAICYDEMKVGEDVKHGNCRHGLHLECSREWLRQKTVCPHCMSVWNEGNAFTGKVIPESTTTTRESQELESPSSLSSSSSAQ